MRPTAVAALTLTLALACAGPDPGVPSAPSPSPTPTQPAPAPALVPEGLVGPVPAMGLPDGPQFQVVALGGPCDRDAPPKDVRKAEGKLTITVCTNTGSRWYDESRDPYQGDAKDVAVRYVGLSTRKAGGEWSHEAPGWVLASDVGKWVTLTAPVEADVTGGEVAIWAEAEADSGGDFGMYLYKPVYRAEFSAVAPGVTLLDAGGGAAGLDQAASALASRGVTRGGAAPGGSRDFLEVFFADANCYGEAEAARNLLDGANIGRKIVITPWPESPTCVAVAVGEI